MTFVVAIDSDTFEVYAGLPATLTYNNGKRTDAAQAARDLSDDDQARTLIEITRYLDSQPWQGTAKLSGTTLQFPRSELVDAAGATIDDATQLAVVAKAVGELFSYAADDPEALDQADTSANIRRADAGGGTGVEFFNPTLARLGTASTLPTPAQRLLGQWLASPTGAAVGGDGASGSSTSDFAACRDYDRRGAF